MMRDQTRSAATTPSSADELAAPERGFTIVELLVAMAIAGILISFIFAVYTRMSVAYRAQNRVTSVVQNLRVAQDRLVRELRMAGDQIPQADYRPRDGAGTGQHFAPNHQVPLTAQLTDLAVDFNGLKVAPQIGVPGQPLGHPLQPVYITNGAGTVPDEVRFFYADRSVASKVDAIFLGDISTVDLVDHDPIDAIVPTAQFEVDDFVILVNHTQEPVSLDVLGDTTLETFDITAYEACLLQVTAKPTGTQLVFSEATSNFNEFGVSSHCDDVAQQHISDLGRPAAARADTMIYRLEGRAYRIDPARRETGILQYHPTGQLTNPTTWLDLGIGFTNMQIASRWFDNPGVDNDDQDSLAHLNWYSGDNQEFRSPLLPLRPTTAVMVGMTLSLESRSFAEVDNPTPQIEGYTSGSEINFSDVGDGSAVTLPVTTDPRYDGDYLFRWSTINFEFRNVGRGR